MTSVLRRASYPIIKCSKVGGISVQKIDKGGGQKIPNPLSSVSPPTNPNFYNAKKGAKKCFAHVITFAIVG